MENGRWKMADGKWQTADGGRRMANLPSIICHVPSYLQLRSYVPNAGFGKDVPIYQADLQAKGLTQRGACL